MDKTVAQAIADFRKERELAETEIRDLRLKVEELSKAIQGLEHAQSLFSSRNKSDLGRLGPDAEDWVALVESHRLVGLRRTDAIHEVLRQSSEPLAPKEIAVLMTRFGRKDSAEEIGATLGHLKREGRAVSVGYGQWVSAGSNPS